MNPENTIKKTVVVLSCCLLLLSAVSLGSILRPPEASDGYIAEIYQNGVLLDSLSLNAVKAPYSFTISGEDGAYNELQVQPGSIGIVSASCPDKLCVHQGFVRDTRLPITCLPNKLVIILHPASDSSGQQEITTDIVTY